MTKTKLRTIIDRYTYVLASTSCFSIACSGGDAPGSSADPEPPSDGVTSNPTTPPGPTPSLATQSTEQSQGGGALLQGQAGPIEPRFDRAPPPGATVVAPGVDLFAKTTGSTAASGSDRTLGSVTQGLNYGVPACTQHSIKNTSRGPVIANPKVHLIFWGDWTTNSDPYLELGFALSWQTLANAPAFWTRLSEYGVGLGSYAGGTNYPGGATGAIHDSTITAGITSAIGSGGTGSNDLWVVFLANGTSAADHTNTGGNHTYYINSGGTHVRYAVVEYGNYNPIVSHEISEAVTDPEFTSYIDTGLPKCQPNNQNCEIGDPCQSNGNMRSVAGIQIEQIWSQQACSCVTERDLGTVNYPNYVNTEDPTVWRTPGIPGGGTWWVKNNSTTNWNWGAAGDVPYAADFNGDGVAEWAIFRDGAAGTMFQLNTAAGTSSSTTYGTTGDVPVRADFDGDGKSDIAVWRPSSGTWYAILSAGGNYGPTQWGTSGDIPVPGDYDGDGKTDPAVFRPSNGTWYVIRSGNGSTLAWSWTGTYGDVPVAGDYNGDGVTDWAYWHPADGTWHVNYNGGSAFITGWGASGDIPLLGDFDRDWESDLAVWRPSTGHWYVINSSTFTTSDLGAWGQSGDQPVHRAVLR